MFDKTALDSIQALLAKDTESIRVTDTPAVIIPKDSHIESLERLNIRPSLFKLEFNTRSINDFLLYTAQSSEKETHIYIDTDNSTAVSIFDHGTPNEPEWGNHKAIVTLRRTPAFASLLEMENKKFKQLELVDFMVDWEQNIKFFDENDNKIDFKQSINRIRRLSISKVSSAELEAGDFKSNKSAMESVEIKSGQDTLPAYFTFETEPHEDFSVRRFICQLRSNTSTLDLLLTYRINKLSAEKEDIAYEFKQKITERLGDKKIYLGNVKHG